MANEIVLGPIANTGLTVTAKVYTLLGVQIGSTVSCSEAGSTGLYKGNMPSASQAVYRISFEAGTKHLGTYEMAWDGSAERDVFDLATATATASLQNTANGILVDTGTTLDSKLDALHNLSSSDITAAVPTVAAIQNGLPNATDQATIKSHAVAIKTQTDQFTFVAGDVQATLDGELVTTDAVSRNASKADIASLATTSQLSTTEGNIRGTDSRDLSEVYTNSGTSGLASLETKVTGIKSQTDKFTFNSANDVKSTLDGEEVTTDGVSRTASQASTIGLATSAEVSAVSVKVDANKVIVDAIKLIADNFTFTGGDVKCTLDGELVTTDSASRDASKADVSALALQANLTTMASQLASVFEDSGTTLPTLINALNNPAKAEIATQILDTPIEGNYTVKQFLLIMGSALAGNGGPNAAGTAAIYEGLGSPTQRLNAAISPTGGRTVTKDVT